MDARSATQMCDQQFRSEADAQVVRLTLDQARDHPVLDPRDLAPDELLESQLVNRHRVGPLLHRAWPSLASKERLRRLTLGQLHLVATAHEIGGLLRENGVETRVLKGLATAELDYHTPSLRHTGDVDLLVTPTDFPLATALIRANGSRPYPGLSVDPYLMKGSTFVHPSGIEIDIHFRLSRYFPPATDALMTANPAPLSGGLFALPAELRLIHAAAHSLITPITVRRLSSFADITAIIDNTGVDWEKTRRAADHLGFTKVVGVALRAEAKIIGREAHPGLDWPEPTGLLRRTFIDGGRHVLSEHLLAVGALPPNSSKVQYVKGWLLPAKDSLDYRGGRAAYFKRLYRQFRS